MSQSENSLCDDRIKAIIHHHYMVKNMPLGKGNGDRGKGEGLIDFMHNHHNFKRSRQQYRRLFIKWSWFKNRPKEEYRIVEHKVKERKKRGRESDVYLRGNLIPRKELQKEFSRKGYMTTQERLDFSMRQTEKSDSEIPRSPPTPATFVIRSPSAVPLYRLAFDNLPILGFLSCLSDSFQGMFTGEASEELPLDRRALLLSENRVAGDFWSLLSQRNGVHSNSQQFIDAILPSSALVGEPRTQELAIRSYLDVNHAQIFNMASFILSNNLHTEENGKALYQWMRKNGGMSALNFISSIRSPAAKSLLENLFRLAIEAGDIQVVQYLLGVGVSPNERQCRYIFLSDFCDFPDLLDPLQAACIHGDIEIAQMLLRAGSKVVEEGNGWSSSLLVLAIVGGSRGRRGITFPFQGYEDGDKNYCDEAALLQLVKRLVDAGAKINPVRCNLASPLSYAARYLNVDIVKYLIDSEADVNYCTGGGLSVLEECLQFNEGMRYMSHVYDKRWMRSKSSEIDLIVRTLLASGTDASRSQVFPMSSEAHGEVGALDMAAWIGISTLVEELITRGAKVTSRCIQFALEPFDLPTFRCLLKNGAPEITQKVVDLLVTNPEAYAEWMRLHVNDRMNAQINRYLILEAVKYDSKDMLCMLPGSANSHWRRLLCSDENAIFGFEECSVSYCTETDENCFEEDRLDSEFDQRLMDAVSHCATHRQFAVLSEIVPRTGNPASAAARCFTEVLRSILKGRDCGSHRCPLRDKMDPFVDCTQLDLELIQTLIHSGANVNHGFTSAHGKYMKVEAKLFDGVILCTAIQYSNDLVIETIIKAGANLNAMGRQGTILTVAIKAQRERWINYLLESQVNVDNPLGFESFPTALEAAIEIRHLGLFNLLLHRCADLTIRTLKFTGSNFDTSPESLLPFLPCLLDQVFAGKIRKDIMEPLFESALKYVNQQILNIFFESKMFDANTAISHSRRPLYYSFMLQRVYPQQSMKLAEMLLRSGARLDLPIAEFHSSGKIPRLPLLFAVAKKYLPVVSLFLKEGALADGSGPGCSLTTLHISAYFGNPEMTHILLDYGANPNPNLQQELISADYGESFERLLNGEFSRIRNDTPLQVASWRGNIKVAELLIAHGANVNAAPAKNAGATALQYAAMHGFMGIVYLLLENGADINAAPAEINGRTALEGAAEHDRIDIVQLLLNYGAEVHDGEGLVRYKRALEFASNNGHHALREMLEERHA